MIEACEDRVSRQGAGRLSPSCLAVGLSSGSIEEGLSKVDRLKALNSLFGESIKGSPAHATGEHLRGQLHVRPAPACEPMDDLGMGPASCRHQKLVVRFVFSPPHSMFLFSKNALGELP